jgi:hypothetical protein
MSGRLVRSIIRNCSTPHKIAANVIVNPEDDESVSVGAVLDGVLINVISVDTDAVTLNDSLSTIKGSTLIANGTGKSINAATAKTFTGRGNTLPQGLGANVTQTDLGELVTPTAAAVTTIQNGLATPTNITAASGVALSATGADLIAKTSTFALAMADAVLDEATSGHTGAGTLSKAIIDALEDTGTTLPGLINLGVTAGTVHGVGTDTTTIVTHLAEATNDFYVGSVIVFTSGNLVGQARRIIDYAGDTKTLTLASALTDTPADNETFIILGHIED